MSDGFVTAVIGLAGLALLGGLLWKLRDAGRSMTAQSRRGLMARMMARQGVAPPVGTTYSAEAAAHAVRRCVMCRAADECERFLETGDCAGFEAFCPNAHYIVRQLGDDREEKAPAG